MADIEQGFGSPAPGAPIQQQEPQTIFQRSSNPMSLVFLFLFRTLAIFFYFFGAAIFNNGSLGFVMIILMLAFDFWTVSDLLCRSTGRWMDLFMLIWLFSSFAVFKKRNGKLRFCRLKMSVVDCLLVFDGGMKFEKMDRMNGFLKVKK